jgi:hypothetical protein
MRVLRSVAVAGEVLRARNDALLLQAGDECRDVPRDEARLRAERSDPDHGVLGIRVHVGDRREVEVDAHGGELARDRCRNLLGQRGVVDDAECPVSGI